MYDSLKIIPKTRSYQIIFNHTNFHLYHYAGNNPIKYTDPNGRSDNNFTLEWIMNTVPEQYRNDAIKSYDKKRKEIAKRDEIFQSILDLTKVYGWEEETLSTDNGVEFNRGYALLTNKQIDKLKEISKLACTAGAIELRNLYRFDKMEVNGWAVDLRNGNDITYYRDSSGNILKDPLQLFEKLQVGDLLIYINPQNPEGIKDGRYTGHTASIIEKGIDYVITIEFHEHGQDPTINKIYKDTLLWFTDTELYGGASWN